MEKALNLRLFTKTCDHPQWRSGYARSGQLEGTGFNSADDLLFPFFLFFLFCFVLFAYLYCCFFFLFFFCF